MALHNDIGRWGEDLACERLVSQGYAVRHRNWRMGRYEIDIVAMKDATVVFCEVKTRSDLDCDPLDAVDDRRIAHMVAAARVYMEAFGLENLDVRFDLFGIKGSPSAGHTLEHIADAFDIPLSCY